MTRNSFLAGVVDAIIIVRLDTGKSGDETATCLLVVEERENPRVPLIGLVKVVVD